MSQPFDMSRFLYLPPEVVKAFAAMQFELSVERAARQHQQAAGGGKGGLHRRTPRSWSQRWRARSSSIATPSSARNREASPAQLELALEDLETAIAETEVRIAAVEERIAAERVHPAEEGSAPARKARALPESLPRVEQVIEPKCIACHCGCGDMVRIGEDRTERLDVIPARYQVIVTVRPKYACSKGRTGVLQAKAPAHLLEGSWPTEALLAHIAVAKHSEHMPLNRQAVVMARHGVPIDRSVLADWMGEPARRSPRWSSAWRCCSRPTATASTLDETTAPAPRPRARQDENGISLGRAARRSGTGRPGTARRGVPRPSRPRWRVRRSEILEGFTGTIQVDEHTAAYSHLSKRCPEGRQPPGAGVLLGPRAEKTDRSQAQGGLALSWTRR